MADDALTAAITEALRRSRMVPYEDGRGGWLFRDATPEEQAEQVAQVVREHTAAQEAEARAEALDVAGSLLRRVADYWDGRPLTHHGDHIYADLVDVLRGIEADARHNRAEGLDAEPAPEQDGAHKALCGDLTGERDGSGER